MQKPTLRLGVVTSWIWNEKRALETLCLSFCSTALECGSSSLTSNNPSLRRPIAENKSAKCYLFWKPTVPIDFKRESQNDTQKQLSLEPNQRTNQRNNKSATKPTTITTKIAISRPVNRCFEKPPKITRNPRKDFKQAKLSKPRYSEVFYCAKESQGNQNHLAEAGRDTANRRTSLR